MGLTPSLMPLSSPKYDPSKSRAWTSQWETGFFCPLSALRRIPWTTVGTDHSIAAGFLSEQIRENYTSHRNTSGTIQLWFWWCNVKQKKQVQVTRALHRPNSLKQIQNVKPMTFPKSLNSPLAPKVVSSYRKKKKKKEWKWIRLSVKQKNYVHQ